MILVLSDCSKTATHKNLAPDEAIRQLIEDAKELASQNPDSAIKRIDALFDSVAIPTKQKYDAYIAKGHALSRKFEMDKSDSILNEAMNWAVRNKDTLAQIEIYNRLGVNETQRGEFNSSKEYYNRAEKLASGRTDTDKHLVNITNNKGVIYWHTGKLDSAKYYYDRAMDYAVRLDDKNAQAMVLINIGSIFSIYNEFDKMELNLRRAIELYGDQNPLATLSVTINLAGSLTGSLKFDSALVELRRAERMARKLNLPQYLGYIYYNEGELYFQTKEYAKSIECLHKSLDIRRSLNDSLLIVSNLTLLSATHKELGEHEKAIEYGKKAIRLAKQFDNRLLWQVYDDLYYVLSEKGDWKSAAKILEERNAIKDSLFLLQKFEATQELQTKYETAQNELQIATLTTKQQYQEKMKILYIAIIIIMLLLIISLMSWLRNQQKKQQQQIIELKQRIIRSKYIPHFTGNILNSINYLIEKDKRLAQQYVSEFGEFNRDSLLNAGKLGRSLCEELAFTKQYLKLEKLRFEDKLEYSVFVDQTIHTSLFIPVMLLHTFCENAIKHGLRHKEGIGFLKIEVYPQGEYITLAVEDNGIGRKAAREKRTSGTGEGLSIIKQQINFLNKENRQKAYLKVTDLHDNQGNASGTRFEFYMPNEYRISI